MASDFRDDLFGDDFDDDFDDGGGYDDAGFDDDLGGFEDDGFEDEFGGLGLDDDEDFGDFDEDFSEEFASTSGGGGGGPSTTFIIIAVVMIIILLGALGLIGYLVIIAPASPSELTSTAVIQTNDAVQILAEQSATQNKLNLDGTMTAESYTDTPTPTLTPSDTPTPTEDTSAQQTAAFESTLIAANQLATETAIAATQTLGAQLNPPDIVIPSPTPLGVVPTEGVAAIPTFTSGDPSVGLVNPVAVDVDGAPVFVPEGTAVALINGTPVVIVQTGPINLNVPIVQGTPVAIVNGTPVIILNSVPLTTGDVYITIVDSSQAQDIGGTPVLDVNGTPAVVVNSVSVSYATPITIAGGATGQAVSLSAVQMTATALADILVVQPTAAGGTPIADGGSGGGDATPTREIVGAATSIPGGNNNLPDTGLFDDVFGGNPLTIFLAAFGLLGVIVVSRRLRGANRKRK